VLKAYPQAMAFTNQTAKRVQAKTRLNAANSEIQAAHNFIKNTRKPSALPNLFEVVDGGTAADLANYCKALAQSLSGVVTLPNAKSWQYDVEGRRLNLSKLFDSPSSPRLYLPDSFDRGFIRPGSWKDATAGGIFPDLKKDELDALALDYQILQNTSLEPYTFTTISGRAGIEGYKASNGTVLYGDIRGLTVDPSGNVYVADGRNHVIRKITPQGKVSDVVGKRWVTQREVDKLWNNYSTAGKFEEPSGIFHSFGGGLAFDSAGNLSFTADGILYKFTKAGKLIHFAGSWEGAVRNGKGKNARFAWPSHIAAGKDAAIYVCDPSAVRKVDAAGNVTTLAGKLGWWWDGAEGYLNGVGTKERFDSLGGIAVDSKENVFVIDGDNHVIRKILANGRTSTFAGRLQDDSKPFDAVGAKALFGGFSGGLAIDKSGNLFVADNELIRKITPQAKVTTIGGKNRTPGRRDGTGESALFGGADSTRGLAVDAQGRIYVADETTLRRGVRKLAK
jgi:DNA-binding beta-propeller fold protein YncE